MAGPNIIPISKQTGNQYAKKLLSENQVIVAPTDTVYGLMCRFDRSEAIECLYTIKKRPKEKAIPVLLGNIEQLPQVVRIPLAPVVNQFVEEFWPGPLTVVLTASSGLPAILTAGQSSVAVRIPQHCALRHLLDEVGPLAATSANISGQPETHTAAEVSAQLGQSVPLILDGGISSPNPASTIVDFSTLQEGKPRILRPGLLQREIEAFWENLKC
ncbi:threonylcarbamoyl-AMP synthase [Chloroflexi bacterium TSY]|nr:threonylcarbamoyl-AMP synthase [Chloroflexi bacterium TSY]